MAQTIFMTAPSLHSFIPSSPDPTTLRLLAFSVAEAALQSNPNSPSFGYVLDQPAAPSEIAMSSSAQRTRAWAGERSGGESATSWGEEANKKTAFGPRKGRPLWDVVERARGRRERENSSLASTDLPLPLSPPISPASYNFALPPNSPLAASIAATSSRAPPPSLNLSLATFPLYTRSAEPSPTNSTFGTLDQSRPPPEFKPRLSASEYSAQSQDLFAATKQLRGRSGSASPAKSTLGLPGAPVKANAPSRHTAKLPSLAQIHAKMSKTHRRGGSVGSLPQLPLRSVIRSDSVESVETLVTPTKDRSEASMNLGRILSRRPPTPPSPAKEGRLAPFLRQRTNGRLAGARPLSMPPVSLDHKPVIGDDEEAAALLNGSGPTLMITPPTFESRPSIPPPNVLTITTPTKSTFSFSRPSGITTPMKNSFDLNKAVMSPTESRFSLAVSTPPSRWSPRSGPPASPTESVRSMRSNETASPTLSVPIITCTPAPSTVLLNGVEYDSDEDEGDVVVFDGEAEEVKEREEREKRGKQMRDRLMLRRRSD